MRPTAFILREMRRVFRQLGITDDFEIAASMQKLRSDCPDGAIPDPHGNQMA
jgi:hypothetical protein